MIKLLGNILVILFMATGNLSASDRKVSGCITGNDGEVLPYANILLKNTVTGAVSDVDGNYLLQFLKPGRYTFLVKYAGYETVEQTFHIRRDTTINFRLKEDIMNLSEVVVTGTRTPKMLKDAPVITRLITADEIRMADAATIKDLLEIELPGMEFNRAMDGQVSINMQGMGGTDVLFLIDGERLAGETLDNVDYNRLNLNNIERIEIIKGAASALYGSNAIGGVVNIITKEASEPWQLNLNGHYGAHNEQRYGASFGLKQKKWNSLTNFNYNTRDTYTLTDTVGSSGKKPVTTSIYGGWDYTVSERLTYRPTDKLSLTLSGWFYNRERDFSEKVKDRYKSYRGSARGSYLISDKQNVELSYVYDQYDKWKYKPLVDTRSEDYSNIQHTARAQYNYTFARDNTLTAGAEFLAESLETYQFKEGDHSTNTAVAYLQHDWNVLTDLNFLYGVRMDYHSAFGAHFSPKVSAMYKIKPVTLRASYAGGFRSPTLKELYTDWDHQSMFRLLGNPDLVPEKSHNFSLSAEYSRNRVNFSVIGYYNKIRDKISSVYKTKTETAVEDTLIFRNIGRSSVKGIDANLAIKCPYGIGVKISYAYVYDKQISSDGVNVSSSRPHSATARLDYGLKKKNYSLNAALNGRLLSKVTVNSVSGDDEDTVVTATEYPAYTMWKLVVSQQVWNTYILTLGVDNLFDYAPKKYSSNSSISSGRTFFAGLSINVEQIFKKH